MLPLTEMVHTHKKKSRFRIILHTEYRTSQWVEREGGGDEKNLLVASNSETNNNTTYRCLEKLGTAELYCGEWERNVS